MKKLIFFAVALCAMVATVSCNKELETALGGKTKTVFTVSTEEVVTKAIADGTNINALHWEIYLTSNVETASQSLGKGVVIDQDGDKNFTVDLNLVTDQYYTILFWAQVSPVNERNDGLNDYYELSDLREVAINYHADDLQLDDENRSAFFARYDFNTIDSRKIEEKVMLYRPFAQINLGTDNLKTSFNNLIEGMVLVESTEITVPNVATVFNTVEGMGEEKQTITYKRERTPYDDYKTQLLEVEGKKYHWLSMNYVAVCGDSDNVTLGINVNTNVGKVTHSVDNVPLKVNHRTNILGDLLTTKSHFEIIVDEKFVNPATGQENPDENKYI